MEAETQTKYYESCKEEMVKNKKQNLRKKSRQSILFEIDIYYTFLKESFQNKQLISSQFLIIAIS